jgi:hypothetical protein
VSERDAYNFFGTETGWSELIRMERTYNGRAKRVFRNAQSLALATGDRLKVATGAAATLFVLLTPHEACAQTSSDQAGSSISLGARGGFSTDRTQSVSVSGFDLDIGVTYFLYPGEVSGYRLF